jgi:cytochrome c peroxidase
MALDEYDVTQLDPAVQTQFLPFNTERALSKLEENREAGLPTIRNIKLTDPQVIDISSFLLTLTDPCVKSLACLNPWIPDDDDSDPDGLRLKARMLTSVAQ